MKNKLMIAGAGTGKTTFLIEEALKSDKKVLITTYTINCKNEIIEKIVDKNGFIPSNITVQTWFSLLLQHGIKPYKRALEIKHVKGINMVPGRSGYRFTARGVPVYWGEKNFYQYYFDKKGDLYTDKLSKLVTRLDDATDNRVISRIAAIYDKILVDEVQDMAGYDLDILKRLMKTDSKIIMVGDPRQSIYNTHFDSKYKKYSNGNIDNFFKEECEDIEYKIDNDSLNKCYRCHKDIILFVNNFYSEYPPMEYSEIIANNHQGVFLITPDRVEEYIKQYNPIQIIYNAKTNTSSLSPTITMGKSKGATYRRVLLYPTSEFKKYIMTGKANFNEETKNKLYVGMTRPIDSLTFVVDKEENFFDIKLGI